MRFGPPMPIPEINDALKPHFGDDPQARMYPVPGGVMSIFETSSTCEEVAASLKSLEMPLPFFVMPYDTNVIQLPGLTDVDVSETSDAPSTATLTVDQILDKISREGIESLSVEEKATLERGQ